MGEFKDLPINNCSRQSHQPGIPRLKGQFPAQSPGAVPCPLPTLTRSGFQVQGGSEQMGVALLPSAVETLPTPQLWGPNSPWLTTESAIKEALPVFLFSSRDTSQWQIRLHPRRAGWTQGFLPAGHRYLPAPGKSL